MDFADIKNGTKIMVKCVKDNYNKIKKKLYKK